ncbi:MAG: response regulator transcription factor [Chloroflexi bacterium]|nr:response regulator transcription factor [Chloroflexota bacterium]
MPETIVARVLIADPSPLFHEGMSTCLREGKHCGLGIAQTRAEIFPQVATLQPNLVLLGSHLEEQEAFLICREIAHRQSTVKPVFLTPHANDPIFQVDAAFAGAVACLPQDISREEFLVAIDAVMRGHILFSRQILSLAFDPIKFTDKEHTVLKLMADGKTDREIADGLVLSVNTIRKHSQRVLEKLGVHTRQHAVQRARRRGLI